MLWSFVILNDISFEEQLSLRSKENAGYILFLSLASDELFDFEEKLKELLGFKAFDSKTKIIVFTPNSSVSTLEFAKQICEIAWFVARIINIVVVVYYQNYYSNNVFISGQQERHEVFIETYTWFPYVGGNCRDVTEVTMVEKHILQELKIFSDYAFFPDKIPKNFYGCTMNISALGIPPYIIIGNYTDINGKLVYYDSGLGSELLKLFAKKYNITISFNQPETKFGIRETANIYLNIAEGITDFAVGTVAALPVRMKYIDCSTPLINEVIKIGAPCPKQLERVQMIVRIFTPTVWLGIGLVFLFACSIIWLISNSHHKNEIVESTPFRRFTYCLHMTWAIILGISIPQLPKSNAVRYVFTLYVWYCLALNIVFQAFFTTFLIEPGYSKKYKSVDDLVSDDPVYGYVETIELIAQSMGYTEHLKFKKRFDCSDLTKCISRVASQADYVTFVAETFGKYFAYERGVSDISDIICPLNEDVINIPLAIGVHKGNPILDILNRVIKLSRESGFLERFWSV
ncbi:hypothetical protein L9F63_005418 [Diploptera punctata]|uniref:Ionotropic glutamate receptor C-terminal domain-containing protein n=1 Tax=Diploptera punctata TaxID=6984 RepID=A0AAD8E695_DIPPU|nr:hypothetical protein L9F63_005418 [Diploptera punctata]